MSEYHETRLIDAERQIESLKKRNKENSERVDHLKMEMKFLVRTVAEMRVYPPSVWKNEESNRYFRELEAAYASEPKPHGFKFAENQRVKIKTIQFNGVDGEVIGIYTSGGKQTYRVQYLNLKGIPREADFGESVLEAVNETSQPAPAEQSQ